MVVGLSNALDSRKKRSSRLFFSVQIGIREKRAEGGSAQMKSVCRQEGVDIPSLDNNMVPEMYELAPMAYLVFLQAM